MNADGTDDDERQNQNRHSKTNSNPHAVRFIPLHVGETSSSGGRS